jgi:predicted nucleotidyltransferase
MRLDQEQVEKIIQSVIGIAGASAEIFLFGSRLDDHARGGDVDLLLETERPLALIERAKIKLALEAGLGLPVDVVAKARNATPTPFQIIARERAVRLVARR